MKKQKEDKFTVKFNFGCKCGNKEHSKFITYNCGEYMELLCVMCERRYIVEIISKEKEIGIRTY